jgi:uncharacterized protein related to proFAR isomerase
LAREMMQVIPVIDVRGGVAVAAHRGDRARYRPLQTPLAASADPVAVAQGLRSLFPFPTLYVADLDGIERRGADLATQRRLAEAWPGTELWIDDGNVGWHTADVGDLPTTGREPVAQDARRTVPPPVGGGTGGGESRRSPIESHRLDPVVTSHVLGSESLASLDDYESARARAGPGALLSLDFRGHTFIGPPEVLVDSALWPDRVIVMTLARVGSGEGPDLARLTEIIARAEGREVYAAGGVRNADDLRVLRDIGAAGALVATALHNGSITCAEIETVAS